MNLPGDIRMLLEVNNLDSRLLLRERQSGENRVDSDDTRRAFEECPTSGALTDRPEAPDTNRVTFFDASINDGVIRCGENIR
jgi:hypothetical protein